MSCFTLYCVDCPCWYDLTKSNCACCKEGGQQCGAPKGKYCYDKNKLKDKKTKMPIVSKSFHCLGVVLFTELVLGLPGRVQQPLHPLHQRLPLLRQKG